MQFYDHHFDPNAHLVLIRQREDELLLGAGGRRGIWSGLPVRLRVVRRAMQEVAARLHPLAMVLRLVQTWPNVAVRAEGGACSTGPAAIETILAAAHPVAVGSETLDSLDAPGTTYSPTQTEGA